MDCDALILGKLAESVNRLMRARRLPDGPAFVGTVISVVGTTVILETRAACRPSDLLELHLGPHLLLGEAMYTTGYGDRNEVGVKLEAWFSPCRLPEFWQSPAFSTPADGDRASEAVGKEADRL